MEYPCTRAMISDAKTIKSTDTVEQALKIFKEINIRNIPVVDDGKLMGMFGLHQLMVALLPKSATMDQGIDSLEFVSGAAPGIAKRLLKIHPQPVSEFMNKTPNKVKCKTSTMEGLRVMAMKGSPVVIVDSETGEYKGIMSRKTLVDDLYTLLEEIEAE